MVKLLIILALLIPLQAQAVMFMWNENGVTQMSGRAPDCYINPIPKCPRVDVYHNGRLISSNRTEPDEARRRQIADLPAIVAGAKATAANEQQDREVADYIQQQKIAPTDPVKEHAAYLLSEAKRLREKEGGGVGAAFVARGLENQAASLINPGASQPPKANPYEEIHKQFVNTMKQQETQRKLDNINDKMDTIDRKLNGL